jgi:cytochrome oxidase assembly protein ShyY1
VIRVLRRLRQPRYLAFTALMLVVAALCVAAGTWQIARYRESVRLNDLLTANAHRGTVPLAEMHLPAAGSGSSPDENTIRFRRVTITGTYVGGTSFVRNVQVQDTNGFYVLDTLRTPEGTALLVVRGFVASDGEPPASVQPSPTGMVSLTGRLAMASTSTDHAAELPSAELQSINPAEQAARLGSPVYDAYLALDAGQPGAGGLQALPAPDLSNPAGGAYEWQHLAYVIQWYVFALLALAAPLLVSRYEVRDAQRRFLGIDPDALPSRGDAAQLLPGTAPAHADGAIELRTPGELAARSPIDQERIRRAAALADRYGHRLEIPDGVELGEGAVGRRRGRNAETTAAGLSRSQDAYHGSYNDYLWELAMADGKVPRVDVQDGTPKLAAPEPPVKPVIIDQDEV